MVYKKNDISNQPVKHLIKMFCDPQGPVPNDAAPSEYLGRMKAVINDGKSLRGHDHFTHVGFICHLNAEESAGAQISLSVEQKRKETTAKAI